MGLLLTSGDVEDEYEKGKISNKFLKGRYESPHKSEMW